MNFGRIVRLNSLLKESRFVSGHRFSGAVNGTESVPTSQSAEKLKNAYATVEERRFSAA
jgi:hypothetical protein